MIEIYKAYVRDVCGVRSYANTNSCPELTGVIFDRLKETGRVKLLYQTNVVPPDSNSFDDQLIGDSRSVSDFVSGTSGIAALLVVNWANKSPKSISVTREDTTGNPLSDNSPYRTKLGPGRFFYHFPYEQLSHVILTLNSKLPNHRIIYHP